MGPEEVNGQLILDLPEERKNMARYMWAIFADATHFNIQNLQETPFVIRSSGLFPVSDSFDDFLQGDLEVVASRYNLPEGLVAFRNAEPVACAFYLINSLHETLLPSEKWDKYNRYPYQESIQYANDLIETNYVQEIFDELYQKITGESPIKSESNIIWSHDIDYLYSAWKSDLIMAYRRQQLLRFPGILWEAVTRPHRWNNIEKILELEKEAGVQSIFFWLTERGKAGISDNIYIDHADYSFRMKSTRRLWQRIARSGSFNGLHKSAFGTSFDDELKKLPDTVSINRNHFLKINVVEHYKAMEKSGLKYDSTLGFPEHFGFRNSFGRPFQPYNLLKNRPYHFVELPLHMMDTTLRTYLKMDFPQMLNTIKEFIGQHHKSCTISILLHNSQFNFQDKEEVQLWRKLYSSLQRIESFIPEITYP